VTGVPSRSIHLVGGVPLANGREVFATVSAALGPRLRRIPNGETGDRRDWIAHLDRCSRTIGRWKNRTRRKNM
jgi:hypothetical protein